MNNREPVIITNKDEISIKSQNRNPLPVFKDDIVTYTIRVYNKGNVDGYAQRIIDYIPDGLEFDAMHPTNIEYGWVVEFGYGTVRCDYLSKQKDKTNIIKGVDQDTVSYKDIKIALKVIEENSSDKILVNIAEIGSTKNDYNLLNISSSPGSLNNNGNDIDVERLQLKCFNLSLNMSVIKVNKKNVSNNNEIIEVTNGDLVTYLIRVYNDKAIAGYAKEITIRKDEGLEFVQDNIVNNLNGWTISEDGKFITTKKLKDTKINGRLKEETEELNYQELAIVFRIAEEEEIKILEINAQISETSNEYNLENVNLSNNKYCEIKVKNDDLNQNNVGVDVLGDPTDDQIDDKIEDQIEENKFSQIYESMIFAMFGGATYFIGKKIL